MPGRRMLASITAVVAVCAVAPLLLSGGATAGVDNASRDFTDSCGVFPSADGVPANAPSLPDQRAWNQDISQSPVDPSSDQIIDYINSHGDPELHPDFGRNKKYGIPFVKVGAKTKGVRVRFQYKGESDGGKYRVPLNAPIEGGKNGDGDRHAIGVDTSSCKLYELYAAKPQKRSWKAGSGAIWDLRSADLRTAGFTSADAAGLPIFPGLTRYDEVAEGAINHALRITFESTRDAYVNPGSHCAGDTDSPAAPPMGLRLRLKSSYDTSGFTGQAAVIATTLKQYGVINADNGSNWFFSGSYSKSWNDDNLNQLKEIPGSAFEVVKSEAPVVTC